LRRPSGGRRLRITVTQRLAIALWGLPRMLEDVVAGTLEQEPAFAITARVPARTLAEAFAATRARVVVCARPAGLAWREYDALLRALALPAVLDFAEDGRRARLFTAGPAAEPLEDVSGAALLAALRPLLSPDPAVRSS
jgi:hypothetical protein